MMLRRLKEDVEKNLAPKEETIIEARFNGLAFKAACFFFFPSLPPFILYQIWAFLLLLFIKKDGFVQFILKGTGG